MAGIGPRITGVEVGALLSYLAPKVLGQFDPFFPGHRPGSPPTRTRTGGRLLLVAPNIVAIERELERRRQRLPALGLPARGDPPGPVRRRALAAGLPDRPDRPGRRQPPISIRRCSPQMLAQRRPADHRGAEPQRGDLDRRPGADARAAGDRRPDHRGDVPARGPCRRGDGRGRPGGHSPPWRTIRAKFTVRRQGQGFDKVIRKLLGLDAKMRQYRDGAAFCKAVIAGSAWTG